MESIPVHHRDSKRPEAKLFAEGLEVGHRFDLASHAGSSNDPRLRDWCHLRSSAKSNQIQRERNKADCETSCFVCLNDKIC